MCLWVLWAILAKITESQGDQIMCAMLCLIAQSCLTLCDPLDCSLPGSSVHGDSPGKNTGVGCMPSSRGSSEPSDKTQASHIAGGFFTNWAMREAQEYWSGVACHFSRGSSRLRNWTGVSCIAGGFFTSWATRGAKITESQGEGVIGTSNCSQIKQKFW